jgi:hypothetical protein
MFGKWGRGSGEGYRDEAQWNTQIEEAKYATSHGKAFLAYTQGAVGETQAARFGYASLMLASEGSGTGSYSFTPDYANEVWMPEYEYNLGNPTGAEQRETSGVHRRAFEHGLVLVNPTASSRSVRFGGTYSGSGLTSATEGTMQPHTGLILTGKTEAVKTEKSEPVAPIGVTVTVGPEKAHLQWSKGKTRVKYYRVVRNARPVVRTHRRHRFDRHMAEGHVYRYRILGFSAHHKVIARSKLVRVRPGAHWRKIVQRPSKRA